MDEIGLHRSNTQRRIVYYKGKGDLTEWEKLDYKEAVGMEIVLMCLQNWCEDFKFTTEEVKSFEKID